ncbi:2OG-Fe(II) oxygenase [Arenimonas alkanexedens]
MADRDFIEVYDQALSPEICARIVAAFEASGVAVPGRVGGGVLPELKDSRDIQVSGKPEWQEVEAALNSAVFKGLRSYLRTYRYALIAPLMLQVPGADGQLRRIAADDFDTMGDEALANLIRTVLRPGAINLQRYTAGQGGYPYWHCELYPRDASAETLHRHVLWTLYLNDGFGEGETEFLYQGRKIVPRTGSLLIAPAAFTHTHRGNRPLGGDKYIATSWILFQRAEKLFGGE